MGRCTGPITVFLFGNYAYPMLPFIMMEFSGGHNIQEEGSPGINGLVHVSQIRTDLVH